MLEVIAIVVGVAAALACGALLVAVPLVMIWAVLDFLFGEGNPC